MSGRLYDVAPAGRFLVTTAVEPQTDGPTHVFVILNLLTTAARAAQS